VPRYVVDRFEGKYAVLETSEGTTFVTLRAALPVGVSEGTVLISDGDAQATSSPQFSVDEASTRERLESVVRLRDRLRRGPEGDTSL
jgi:hypothetical protein